MRLGALVALWVAALAAAPRSSRADCSHPDRPAIGVSVGGEAGAGGWESRISPAEPEKPKPCSGPQCSGKSAPAPATAPIVRFADFDEAWAWVAAAAGPDPDRSSPLRPEDSAAAGSADPAPIFHPPRRPR